MYAGGGGGGGGAGSERIRQKVRGRFGDLRFCLTFRALKVAVMKPNSPY